MSAERYTWYDRQYSSHWEPLLELIREYAVRMIAYDRNMRQFLYRKCEGLSAAKNGITSQEHDWPGELHVTLRFEYQVLRGVKSSLPGPIFVFL